MWKFSCIIIDDYILDLHCHFIQFAIPTGYSELHYIFYPNLIYIMLFICHVLYKLK